MATTTVTLTQGELGAIIAPKTLQADESLFTDLSLASVTHFNGATPILQEVAAISNEIVIQPVTRSEAWLALTPNEVELNRELAYVAYNPVIATY